MNWNFAHVHIVLNHVPSLGTLAGVCMFIAALVWKDERLQKVSLYVLVMVSLLLLPTYVSGNAAQGIVRSRTEIPRGLIELHQNSAMITLVLMTALGTFAWFGLWQFRRFSRFGSWNTKAILVLSILSAAFILRTASMGGEISHPEIRAEGEVAPPVTVGWRAHVETFTATNWVWPTCEVLHYFGMVLLFGTLFLVTARMLGMMTIVSFKDVHRLLPLGVLGFVLNVISGMIFFIASPGQYTGNEDFARKIVALMIAGICVIYFTAFEQPWKVGKDDRAPLVSKIIAVGTMASLLLVIYFGRILPFSRN